MFEQSSRGGPRGHGRWAYAAVDRTPQGHSRRSRRGGSPSCPRDARLRPRPNHRPWCGTLRDERDLFCCARSHGHHFDRIHSGAARGSQRITMPPAANLPACRVESDIRCAQNICFPPPLVERYLDALTGSNSNGRLHRTDGFSRPDEKLVEQQFLYPQDASHDPSRVYGQRHVVGIASRAFFRVIADIHHGYGLGEKTHAVSFVAVASVPTTRHPVVISLQGRACACKLHFGGHRLQHRVEPKTMATLKVVNRTPQTTQIRSQIPLWPLNDQCCVTDAIGDGGTRIRPETCPQPRDKL